MTAGTLAAVTVGGIAGYSLFESEGIEVNPFTVSLDHFPPEFSGLRVVLITDLHLGYFISLEHIAKAVRLTNSLQPDLILLAGDYIHNDPAYIAPVMEELGTLHAPLGVFGVQGNRDIRINRMLTSQEMTKNGIREITNRGCWINRGGSRLWLCGIDDCTIGHPDLEASVRGASRNATTPGVDPQPPLRRLS